MSVPDAKWLKKPLTEQVLVNKAIKARTFCIVIFFESSRRKKKADDMAPESSSTIFSLRD